VLDPRPVRSQRLLCMIGRTPGLTGIGKARDLTEAYHLTEHRQPDLVLIAEEEARRDSFPMFAAMITALEIDCLLIPARDGSAPPVAHDVLPLEALEADDRLDLFLARRARFRRHPRHASAGRSIRPLCDGGAGWKTVVIGASTGGVEALVEILSRYPEAGPPTLIVQHIGARYLPGLAQRLDRHSAMTVRPARESDTLAPGLVLLAPGNTGHLTLLPEGRHCRMMPAAPVSGHRPSVDVLFQSAARLGPRVVGVLLSGMGRDGAEGLAAIRNAGGMTIAQDAASSVVFGMPRAAQELGAVSRQLPLKRIAEAIIGAARTDERLRHG